MYKKRVNNDRKKFEIPAQIQNNLNILNFPALFSAEYPHLKDKRAGISKKISVILYP